MIRRYDRRVDARRPKVLLTEAANTPTYTVGRAAHYSGIPAATLRSWLFGRRYETGSGRKEFPPIIIPADHEARLLSFVNVAEAHVLARIRKEEGIRMYKVRDAAQHLRERYGIDHPFVDVKFKTDGIDLFVEAVEGSPPEQVSGRERPALRGLVEAQLARVDWEHKLVARLHPFSRTQGWEQRRMVSLSPLVAFGRLVVAGTGVTTSVIASRWLGGEKISDLAEDFGIEGTKIEEALRWEIPLLGEPRAA